MRIIYDTVCFPIWPHFRKRPVYVVAWSDQNFTQRANEIIRHLPPHYGRARGLPEDYRPRVARGIVVAKVLQIPTDRKLRRGSIINPTREVKRFLRMRQSAEIIPFPFRSATV